jgi:hypothetical protein
MQLLHHSLCVDAAVVVSVVKHEYRVLAPLALESVKMLYELHDEQTKGVAVGDASVRSEPHLTRAAHGGDEVEGLKVCAARDLVAAMLGHPPALAMV